MINRLNDDIETLNIDARYINTLKKAGIKNIGHLINCPQTNVVALLNIINYSGYVVVRNALMENGFLFEFDKKIYEQFNIPRGYIFTKIEDLPLTSRVINSLRHNGIRYFGDLLTTDYIKIIRLRNIGPNSVKELRDFVHSLGYNFPGEKDSYKDIMERYQAQGIPLVGEVLNFNNDIANPLYRAGIFTVDDLKYYGPKVFEINGIGKLAKEKIKEAMENHGIAFETREKPILMPENITEDTLEKEQLISEEIKARIEKKRELARKFEDLMQERKELLAYEKKLDQKIADAINKYKALGVNDGFGR